MTKHQKDKTAASPLVPLECFQPAFGKTLLVGMAVLGAEAAMTTATAQESSNTLGEVTVTASPFTENYQPSATASSPKFTAPLLNTPRSITIINKQLIDDRGATSLQDVLRTTPGITLGSGEGGTPVGDRPFVRGYEASTDIFIDGVRDYARGSHETFNLEAIEVTKGPSSAFTGRGGTGGSINLTTKEPKAQRFAEVSAGFGTDGQWRATADANLPMSDTIAGRLNLMRAGGDVPGRGGVEIDRMGIAPSIAFGMGTPTRATLSYAYLENNDFPDLGFPFRNDARPERTRPIESIDRDTLYGRLNADFRENTMKTATAKLEHDISENLTVRNVTRHVSTLNHYLMSRPTFDNCSEGDGPPCSTETEGLEFRRDDRARWRSTKSLINQTDLYGTTQIAGMKHTFSTGLEFSHERIYSREMDGLPGREIDSFHNPNPNGRYDFHITYGDKTKDGSIRTKAIYLLDTVDLNDRLSLNGGLRWENFKVANQETSRKDSFFNYQLGLVYKPAPNGSVYLSYATSSNPAGENLGQGGGADGAAGAAQIRDLKPEKSRTWELGTKWEVLDDGLSLTAAVFETAKTDARSTDPLTGEVSLNGDNRVRGIELGAAGAITPAWQLWAGYSYLDPKIKSYQSGDEIYDGNQIKFIAKQSATLWTTYKILPQLTLGGGATYLGKRYANDANTLELPSHVRYDAMARYDFNKAFSLQLNINNISNAKTYDGSHVGLFANMGPGRSYMLNATYRFE